MLSDLISGQWEEKGEKISQKGLLGEGSEQGRCSNSRDTFHNLEVKGQGVELNRLRVLLHASELALLRPAE